jgi:hypothetical protein
VPGSTGTLQNSQCTVSLSGVSAASNGTARTLTVPVQFSAAFAGVKNIFLSAADRRTVTTGWVDLGDWTVTRPPAPVVSVDAVAPSSGSGTNRTFSLQYSDSSGAANLQTTWAWFTSTTASSANSCLVYYDRTKVYLLNDAGTAWQSGFLGTLGTLHNNQCGVDLSFTSVQSSGTTLTLVLSMSFSSTTYGGAKDVYMYASNAQGTGSGWQDRGDWTVPGAVAAAVTADSVTPGTGSGTTQTFAFHYSHSVDSSKLQTMWVWFTNSTAASTASSCLLRYEYFADRLSLLNDAGTDWISAPYGLGAVLQNSQCSLALPGSFTFHGTSIALNLAMTFKPGFTGARHIYMYATGVGGLTSGWVDRGTWTVPATGTSVTADSASVIVDLGFSQVLEARYSDSLGGTDVRTAWIWITNAFGGSAAASCLMYYDAGAETMSVLDNAGTAWQTAAVGTSANIGNAQCTVHVGSSNGDASGNAFTLQANTSFSGAYAGTTQHIYIFAAGSSTNSGWTDAGTLTIP